MTAPAQLPAYRIITGRLVLRCWQPQDASLLKTSVEESVEHLLPWMPWAHDHPQPLEAQVNLIRRWRSQFDRDEDYTYGIFNSNETRVLGGTGLHKRLGPAALEIGYWVHKDFINQGLASELGGALTRVGFELHHVRRMEIHCDPRNLRSAAIPRKLGYTHEATLRERLTFNEKQAIDVMIWTLFADQYPSSPASSARLEAYNAVGQRIL